MSTTNDSTPRDPDTGSTENADLPQPLKGSDYDEGADTASNEHTIVERYSYSPKHDEYNVLGRSFYDDEDEW